MLARLHARGSTPLRAAGERDYSHVERHKQVRLKAGVRVMVNREREVLRPSTTAAASGESTAATTLRWW